MSQCLICKDSSCTICRTNKISPGLLAPFTEDELCDIVQFRDMPDDGKFYHDEQCTSLKYTKSLKRGRERVKLFNESEVKESNIQFYLSELASGLSLETIWGEMQNV